MCVPTWAETLSHEVVQRSPASMLDVRVTVGGVSPGQTGVPGPSNWVMSWTVKTRPPGCRLARCLGYGM